MSHDSPWERSKMEKARLGAARAKQLTGKYRKLNGKPPNEETLSFESWWAGRDSPERRKLEEMAKLMGFAFKGWCELAYLSGVVDATFAAKQRAEKA